MSEDLFRYCVHCGADCEHAEAEHADDCPQVSGVWPIRAEEQMPCPHCGKDTREMVCMDCGAPLAIGDHYMLRDARTGEVVVKPGAGGIGEAICLGCAARLGLAV